MLYNETFTPHFGAMHLVRGYHISGRKIPQPVLRTILRNDVVNVCITAKVVRKNVSQHPCGARYGSRVRAERSEGEVPGILYVQATVWQTGK